MTKTGVENPITALIITVRSIHVPCFQAAMDDVVYIPTGFFQFKQAWRTNLSGVVKAPFPVFWDVTKA